MKIVKDIYLTLVTTNGSAWTGVVDGINFPVKYINFKGLQYVGTGSSVDILTCRCDFVDWQPIGMSQLAKDTGSSIACENILIEFGCAKMINGILNFQFIGSNGKPASCGASDGCVIICELYDENSHPPRVDLKPRSFLEPAGKSL